MSNHPSKTRAVAIIREAFRKLPDIYGGFRLVIQDTLYDECLAAERQHRKGHPSVDGFSVQTAAQYFAVKYLREYYLQTCKMPTVKEYLHIRHECFTAAAIILEHGPDLTEWVRGVPKEFDSIDYARMMQWDHYTRMDREQSTAGFRAENRRGVTG